MSKIPAEDDHPQPALKPQAKAKPKAAPRGPATKAEHAALKRMDKTVIKRMRKL